MKNKAAYTSALILSAAATGLCVSFYLPAWAELLSMTPYLFVLLSCAPKLSLKRAAAVGFVYFYAYYLTVWHWFLQMYPLDFTEISRAGALIVVTVAWLGLPFLQAVCAMWQVVLFSLMSRSRLLTRDDGVMRMWAPFAYAAVYVVFEWTQTLTWAGVPWGRLAVGQSFIPVMVGSASLFGSYVVSFVVTAVNGCIAYAIVSAIRRDRVTSMCSLTLGAVVLLSNITVGGICMNAARSAEGKTLTAAVLQGSVSSKDKWRDGRYANLFSIYASLAESAAADGAELIVMPETAIPGRVNSNMYMWRNLESLSSRTNTILIATGFWESEPDDSGESAFNNVVFAVDDKDGLDDAHVYKKRHLVPFGEFVPYENVIRVLVPPLSKLGLFDGTISAGDGTLVIPTDKCTVGALVCFDSIYEDAALSEVRAGAQILTVSTNDSWFDGSAAIYQHTAQSVLRAVECGRYVLRAGNTGMSCVIAPTGEITTSLPLLTQSYAVADAETRDNMTLYVRIGNAFVYVCMAVTLGMCICGAVDVYKRKGKSQ